MGKPGSREEKESKEKISTNHTKWNSDITLN